MILDIEEDLLKILDSLKRKNDKCFCDKDIILANHFDIIIDKITILIKQKTANYNQILIENEKLKAQVEMKDNLISMYENIISNSNFAPVIKKDKIDKENK